MHSIPWLILTIALGLASCDSDALTGPVSPTGDVPEATGWRAETLIEGLEHPWAIDWLPDGTALVTERPGRLRVIRDGRLVEEPVGGLPEILAHGQGGLLDLSLHPDFARNRLVYFTYATGTQQANRTALGRGRFDDQRLTSVEVLFEVADDKSGGQHFGARILWLPDQSLLLTIGDGGNPPISHAGTDIREQAQHLGTHFGKILRLTDEGRAHPDNPFIDDASARAEIWSLGHRNIQGLARDSTTGRIWANEHGPRGGDELNLIERGANYGWPRVTYGREYWGPRVSDKTTAPGMRDPKVVWTPSKAPSGLAFYTGEVFPAWQGNLFSGALVFQEVRRITLDGERVVGEDKLSIGQRVRDVRQGPDGYLYILTDAPRGRLLRIVPD
ncbi:PQQ-dependent sugar dehydrogenase [Thioalkalicoccus limnaeus]|uniref:PQQ-dependent sugar dehydrogenase n=1 Tax=Thioalkalicoccus limnaeus TaxID=120681 RepID=A0ABV4BDW2_9GAMM